MRTVPEYREMLEDIRTAARKWPTWSSASWHWPGSTPAQDRLETQEIDARDVARQCTNMIRPLAEAHGLALRLHAPEPVPLKVDPDKLRKSSTICSITPSSTIVPRGPLISTSPGSMATCGSRSTIRASASAPELRQDFSARLPG